MEISPKKKKKKKKQNIDTYFYIVYFQILILYVTEYDLHIYFKDYSSEICGILQYENNNR
jgi:hypothetical protein